MNPVHALRCVVAKRTSPENDEILVNDSWAWFSFLHMNDRV